MHILLTSEYDSEILLEDDISAPKILRELQDRIVEIEVSQQEVEEWLGTETEKSLLVADDYGEGYSLVKVDTFSPESTTVYDYGVIRDIDVFMQDSVETFLDVSELDVDVLRVKSDDLDANDTSEYKSVKRWVESHPLQWYRLSFVEIANELHLTVYYVKKHLADAAISAKYVDTVEEYQQKRKKGERERLKTQGKSMREQSVQKISQWIANVDNYGKWELLSLVQIGVETNTSLPSVKKYLPQLLHAEGYISSASDFYLIRERDKQNPDDTSINYFIEVV